MPRNLIAGLEYVHVLLWEIAELFSKITYECSSYSTSLSTFGVVEFLILTIQ